MHSALIRFGLALTVSTATAGAAGAQGVYPVYGAHGPYGYADAAIDGAYVGAPLTRFPRPNEIVPSAWGYGTYGIPTVAGIPRPPVGEPTVYVINGVTPAARRREGGRARVLSRNPGRSWARDDLGPEPAGAAGGARIIAVTVPRR